MQSDRTTSALTTAPTLAHGNLLRTPRARRPSRLVPWVWGVVAVGGLCGVVALLDAAATHNIVPNSDAASLVLEARAILHGHVLLNGWDLSYDSFWTAEVPFWALALLVTGIHAGLLALAPAFLAGLVIAVGVAIVAHGHRLGATLAGAVTVLAFLAFPIRALALFLLIGGAHVGATLWSLVAFYALRNTRWGPGVAVAAVALAAGMLGDLQTVAYGTVPVFLAALVTMARRRSVRAGGPGVVASVGSCVLALVVREVARAIGTFHIGPANPIASLSQVVKNVRHLLNLASAMTGTRNTLFGTNGVPAGLQHVHIAGAVLLLVCLVLAVVRLVAGVVTGSPSPSPDLLSRRGRRETATRWWASEPSDAALEDMLLIGAFGVATAYLFLAWYYTPAYARYLTGALVFLVVLAGRMVARAWSARSHPGVRAVAGALGVAVFGCFIAGYAYSVEGPVAAQPAAVLGQWLEAHHLTSGVAAYWSSSITTVVTKDAVRVRPVIESPHGKLVRYDRESDASWYKGKTFTFLVFQPDQLWGGINDTSAAATFGPPADAYTIGDGPSTYRVLVWSHPFTVSDR